MASAKSISSARVTPEDDLAEGGCFKGRRANCGAVDLGFGSHIVTRGGGRRTGWLGEQFEDQLVDLGRLRIAFDCIANIAPDCRKMNMLADLHRGGGIARKCA